MKQPANKFPSYLTTFPRPQLVLHDGFLSPAPSFPLDPLSTCIPSYTAPSSPVPLPLASLINCDLLVDVDDDLTSTLLTTIITPFGNVVPDTAKSPRAAGQPLGPPPEPEANGSNPQRPPIRPNPEIRSRFDQEPNPFEVSFRESRSSVHSSSDLSDRNTPPRGTDATSTRHNALPPLSSLTSPAAADPSQFPWLANSLRSGPLSPAMLAGPQGGNSQHNNANNRAGGSNDANGNNNEGAGAFESTGFRTGFTPGTGSGFTPAGYNSFMGPGLGSLAMPSPNTAAFLNSITNSTPLGENSEVAAAAAAANGHSGQHGELNNLQPPSAIPPHLQQHHPLPHNNSQHEVPQETITPNTLSALTGVFGEMARANSGTQGGPPFYASGMGPPHPGAVPVGMPHVDYAQQSANAASQAANGLFLLSQAHQELSKREEEGRGSTPTRGRGGKASNGSAGQKRKSDIGPGGTPAKPAKKGKKNSLGAGAAPAVSPPKAAKQESFDSGDSDDDQDDGPRFGADGKPETEEDKRKNFLERNRQAALKCRQRKKAWLNELQGKVEGLTIENERLQQTIQSMHEEVGRLTAILMQHRDCGLTIPTAYGRPIR
ncbi:uncharacterized protein I206_103060 [Kwoniella pini CBS 10737]|uniref:BZIP domain-containing protein n=1 Tax=Kwoniella pini CBS 10737 TaxID=1296096 RepID=A0A1B9IAY0_9TREE|nr:uncharacterized protein I206_01936 [Kwoniella pini CBS 10737]OCF52643.1 hypothetical protein I206_01936 [Kwoniella pini CBS 10737]